MDNVHIYFIDAQNSVGGTGLFACISKNAVVKNLTIGKNSVVEGTDGSGAVVGAMTGGRIENCVNKASIAITQGLGRVASSAQCMAARCLAASMTLILRAVQT